VVAKVRERFAVSKQGAQKFDGKSFNVRKLNELEVRKFNLRKLNELEIRKQYQIEIMKRLAALEN